MGDAAKRWHVLVIDDDDAIVKVVVRTLAADGFAVAAAGDAEAAFAAIAERTPDLILLDATLPSLSGLEICQMLRARAATRFTPILFLTGMDSPAMREAAFEAGADQFLAKPYRTDQLRVVIHSMLELKRYADELQGMSFQLGPKKP